MHILLFIIIFIIGSVGDALNSNMEGISAVGKVMFAIGLFFVIGIILIGFSTDGSGKVFLVAVFMLIIGFILAMLQ